MEKRASTFYVVFILSIFLVRLGVFLFPSNKIIIDGIRINHFWIGIILMLLVLFLSKRYNMLRMILFSVGLGIAADELVFIIFTQRTINDYWSIYPLLGVTFFSIIVFIWRKKLVDIIYK